MSDEEWRALREHLDLAAREHEIAALRARLDRRSVTIDRMLARSAMRIVRAMEEA